MRWKIDLVILPIFLITQALQFMDKTALNYANLFGYQKALGLKGQQFNYLSASKFSDSHDDIRVADVESYQWSMLDTSSVNTPVVGSLDVSPLREFLLSVVLCGVSWF